MSNPEREDERLRMVSRNSLGRTEKRKRHMALIVLLALLLLFFALGMLTMWAIQNLSITTR